MKFAKPESIEYTMGNVFPYGKLQFYIPGGSSGDKHGRKQIQGLDIPQFIENVRKVIKDEDFCVNAALGQNLFEFKCKPSCDREKIYEQVRLVRSAMYYSNEGFTEHGPVLDI